MPKIALPYFDILLGEISRGKRDIATAFGRHVHWGYWDADHPGDGTMSDFALAADRMSERVWRSAGVAPGQIISEGLSLRKCIPLQCPLPIEQTEAARRQNAVPPNGYRKFEGPL